MTGRFAQFGRTKVGGPSAGEQVCHLRTVVLKIRRELETVGPPCPKVRDRLEGYGGYGGGRPVTG